MTQNKWSRLEIIDGNKILDKLDSNKDAIVFSKTVTEVSYQKLPFYNNYKLYRLINYATMPVFTMLYLGDSDRFLTIDGLSNPIYIANEKDPIKLNEVTIIPYLDFFFEHVKGSEGDVFLIKDPKRMPFMKYLNDNQKQNIEKSFKPIEVTYPKENNKNFEITGNLYYGGGIINASISVDTDGKIRFNKQNMLMSGIFLPDNPYGEIGI